MSECGVGCDGGKHLNSLGSYLRVANVIFGVVSHCFLLAALKCDCICSVTRHSFQVAFLYAFLLALQSFQLV